MSFADELQQLEQWRLDSALRHEAVVVARQKCLIPGEPVVIEGGWRVRETGRYFVDVMRYSNLRMVITPKAHPMGYDRGWCYQEPLHVVIMRCFTFDPDAGEEPIGWVKEVGTERRGCAAYYLSEIKAHKGFDPDCPDCGREELAGY